MVLSPGGANLEGAVAPEAAEAPGDDARAVAELLRLLPAAVAAMESSARGFALSPLTAAGSFELEGARREISAGWLVSGIHSPRVPPSAQCVAWAHPAGRAPSAPEASLEGSDFATGWPISLRGGVEAVTPEDCARALAAAKVAATERARSNPAAVAAAQAERLEAALAFAKARNAPKAL